MSEDNRIHTYTIVTVDKSGTRQHKVKAASCNAAMSNFRGRKLTPEELTARQGSRR